MTLRLTGAAGRRPVTVETVETAIQRRQVRYDQTGDDHYQTISAFIKSIRGSDPDGAVFWLAKMLKAGEDPRFIARRLVISASEDVGLADSQGLVVATAAYEAVERVGLPEAGLILAHATVYLATAPKSNSAAKAVWQAQAAIESGASLEVPLHLRNASFSGAQQLGYGQGYEYSHDFSSDDPRRYRQHYLPPACQARSTNPAATAPKPPSASASPRSSAGALPPHRSRSHQAEKGATVLRHRPPAARGNP